MVLELDEDMSGIGREKAVLTAVALQTLGKAYALSGTTHHPQGSRTNLPTPRTSSTPDPNSSNHSTTNSKSSSIGLGGIGTGLGNLGRDIGPGLGGMVGFRASFTTTTSTTSAPNPNSHHSSSLIAIGSSQAFGVGVGGCSSNPGGQGSQCAQGGQGG
ncbi:hypothetical protein F5051DRAFT_442898 [Lentinula edodes]|nr:hypothetical protein F5051DRAFT_442898 [Lentinula edodes]